MHDIEIDFTTGSSFGSERTTELLGNVSNLDNAKINLKRIKEHYIKCEDNPNTGDKYELTLLTDDGERTITPFWIGYFEILHGARVVADEDDDLSFDLD